MIARRSASALALASLALRCGGEAIGYPTGSSKCATTSDCHAGQFCNPVGFCQSSQGCSSNAQCPLGQACDPTSGTCRCSGDGQCPVGQGCTANGRCQGNAACGYNGDCPPGQLCDTQSHSCIAQGTCGQNLQCPLGQVCSNGTCQTGCTVSGDCQLVDFTQSPPAVQAAACINFVCVANGCNSNADCPIFSSCVLPRGAAAAAGGRCGTVCGTSQFCQSCDPSDPSACGGSGICLDDPRNQASCQGPGQGCRYFCGLDCSRNQTCPQATSCTQIIALNQLGTGGPGQACNVGELCSGPTALPCPVQEGAQSGACPCYADTDCPVDGSGNHLACTDGACVIGATCGPLKQYSCSTLSCGAG